MLPAYLHHKIIKMKKAVLLTLIIAASFISGFAFRVSALSTLPDQHELVTRLYETGRLVFDSSFTRPMTIRLSTALHMS